MLEAPGVLHLVSRNNDLVITEADVRRVALSLPATTEKPSYGTPGFRVKNRLFARIREEGDVLVVWRGPSLLRRAGLETGR